MRHRLQQADSPYTTFAAFSADMDRVWNGLIKSDQSDAARVRQGMRMRTSSELLLSGMLGGRAASRGSCVSQGHRES